MCYACKPGDGYAKADPRTVVYEFLILPGTAAEQRANLEASRERNSLCEKHLANYEAVVKALEAYSAKKWPTRED